jgi:hypothetical protein
MPETTPWSMGVLGTKEGESERAKKSVPMRRPTNDR